MKRVQNPRFNLNHIVAGSIVFHLHIYHDAQRTRVLQFQLRTNAIDFAIILNGHPIAQRFAFVRANCILDYLILCDIPELEVY